MSKFNSPLRYPGGKVKLAKYIQNIFRSNDLYDGIYYEPYAGGASVALSLLFLEYVSSININDFDKNIYYFWKSIIYYTELFCKKIIDTPINIKEWSKQKEIINSSNNESELDIGFATFFLNRTNRSGIIKAGVIGGKTQSGKWKLDVRFNKQDLIKRIERIALYQSRINIYNLDACDFIRDVISKDNRKKVFTYLDPPYLQKGMQLYTNYYQVDDHREVSESINIYLKSHWLVSYDYSEFIKNLYSQYRINSYNLSYTAGTKYIGKELLIYSNNLNIPENNNSNKIVTSPELAFA